ncbi:MAG: PD-(D/E)XK nuclease family protein [Candidatus Colwellbacteria bacterium]|nr:PD-(D/E)XK nuclease family protein [Candidatus Colwellbacteria bacterium]
MSQYYNSRRTKGMYEVDSPEPFKLSRSKVDLFLECPRCFYLDRRLGVSRPPGFPFSLNSAVDALLKKEFDIHRAQKSAHPLMKQYGINAVPFEHKDINKWRDTFVGVQYLHEPTNFLLTGAIDDVWVDPKGRLSIVDYKATAKDSEVNLDADWQIGYKRQMEFYQWLMRQNGFDVSATGYFVYANGRTDKEAFDGRLEFNVKVIPYEGDSSWIEPTLRKIKEALGSNKVPKADPDCDYCLYRDAVKDVYK